MHMQQTVLNNTNVHTKKKEEEVNGQTKRLAIAEDYPIKTVEVSCSRKSKTKI